MYLHRSSHRSKKAFSKIITNDSSFFLTVTIVSLRREEQAKRAATPDVDAENGGSVRLRPPRELP